jgi:hypothetical protein
MRSECCATATPPALSQQRMLVYKSGMFVRASEGAVGVCCGGVYSGVCVYSGCVCGEYSGGREGVCVHCKACMIWRGVRYLIWSGCKDAVHMQSIAHPNTPNPKAQRQHPKTLKRSNTNPRIPTPDSRLPTPDPRPPTLTHGHRCGYTACSPSLATPPVSQPVPAAFVGALTYQRLHDPNTVTLDRLA